MTFRTQLVMGHAVSLMLVAATALTAILALRVAARDEDQLVHELAGELDDVQRLRFQAEQLVATSRGYLLTGNISYLERYQAAEQKFGSTLREIERWPLDRVARLRTVATERAFVAYSLAADQAERARSRTDADGVVSLFGATLQPRRDELERRVEELYVHERTERDALLARAQTVAHRAEIVVLGAATCAVILGVVLAGFAIAKLALQYERLGAARRAAEAAIAARDDVLSMVSHDLRNPLGSIALAATMADDETSEDARRQQLRIIHNATERMQSLIEAQLEAARLDGPQELHREVCSVADIVDTTAELFHGRAAAGQIELRSSTASGTVIADRERVIEILSNLIGNALQHTPRSGAITVSVRVERNRVRFAVQDTGPGIPAGHLPFLFDRHWRGTRGGKGLGLGLYICKRIVDAHGGVMGVDSLVGRGTTFWFTLGGVNDPTDHSLRRDS